MGDGPTVGLLVNPAAGRDIRRLTGGASVSDNYAKRRTGECVLAGLELAGDPVEALVMPDRASLGQRIAGAFEGETERPVSVLEQPVTGTPDDTRAAAARFAEVADAVVVLGGDGTTRDVATAIGDVPVVAVSTGTNNVVPTPMDGTIAGAAAALLATEAVDPTETTVRHGTVRATIESGAKTETMDGLSTMGVLDRPFVGTRAILDASEFVGAAVSRAFPAEIGLSGVAGGLFPTQPDDPGGAGLRFGPVDECDHRVRAITVPGVVSELGIGEGKRLEAGDPFAFEVERGVVTADGEREREVSDATVTFEVRDEGPRIVDVEAVFEAVADVGAVAVGWD